MNKKLNMAVAGAVLAMGASAANAGITIPAGDWTIDIGGNVNSYYTHTTFSGNAAAPSSNEVQTGLLPSALGIGGKSRQDNLDVGFQFTYFVGAGGNISGNANTINIRQAFGYFGDKSWGQIKYGRDLGVYGSDAILSDMTLLGVGVGGGGGSGTSTLGRIGAGYQYADWVGQLQYSSPNWNGFSFAAAIRQPWTNNIDGTTHDMGFDGKASYEWAGDFAGKVWVGGISEKYKAVGLASGYTADSGEIGGKVSYSGAELVGYYYGGSGTSGGANILNGLLFRGATKGDVSGGYVQGTYKVPGVGTKIGLSWGESNTKDNGANSGNTGVDYTEKAWVVGVYHPLTKSVNLVAEYTDNKMDNVAFVPGSNGKARTTSLGAIMFF